MKSSSCIYNLTMISVLIIGTIPSIGITQDKVRLAPENMTLGPIRHNELPPDLVARIKAFEQIFSDVYPITHEKWLEGFQRDVNPEQEITTWERIADAFTKFTAGQNLSQEIRNEIFGLLLFRSTATTEATLEQVNLRFLTKKEAIKLLELYKAEGRPITYNKN